MFVLELRVVHTREGVTQRIVRPGALAGCHVAWTQALLLCTGIPALTTSKSAPMRLARLAVAAGMPNWVKLEIHPDPRYLLPDPIETLKAAEVLVNEGFTVLPYINADPVLARRLQDVGTATVMPLGSPIGSHQGLTTRRQIEIILAQATVPVVVDAGIGAPSHAAEAFELGADAVLVNTAIAIAADPARMATAFKAACEAGRAAYEIGLAEASPEASATSPLTTFLYQSPD